MMLKKIIETTAHENVSLFFVCLKKLLWMKNKAGLANYQSSSYIIRKIINHGEFNGR